MTRHVLANDLPYVLGEENPIESLKSTIAFSSADWGSARDLAWIYGIVLGWDGDPDYPDDGDPMAELQEKFGWDDGQVARLRRLHDRFESLRGEQA
jgi:hypothetical protein